MSYWASLKEYPVFAAACLLCRVDPDKADERNPLQRITAAMKLIEQHTGAVQFIIAYPSTLRTTITKAELYKLFTSLEREPWFPDTVVDEKPLHESEREALSPDTSNYPDKVKFLQQAYNKFWALADPQDRSTHPVNNDVIRWLEEKGFSPNLAKAGASIIRPEWAKTGRPPEE